MLTTLILGILLTALALGALWGGFRFLRQRPRFDKALNSREANKRMMQLTLIIYFVGLITTIAVMA